MRNLRQFHQRIHRKNYPLGFYFDNETGLYYLRSRYYNPIVGRFINSDEPSCIDFNSLPMEQNLLTYCNNAPIRCYDPNGHSTIVIAIAGIKLTIDTVTLIVGCIIALIPILMQLLRDLPKIIRALSDALDDLFDALAVAVKKAVAARQQRTKAKHHIIAKSAWRADPARKIWTKKMKFSINDSRNLAQINQTLHYFVHTRAYYDAVNALVILGYTKGKAGVLAIMRTIRTVLLTISKWYF